MNKKYVTGNGFLAPEGDQLFAKIRQALRDLYYQVGTVDKCSEQEISTLTSILHKVVGDINAEERMVRQEAALAKNKARQRLFDMSDEEFDTYLVNKYGSEYNIFTPMTSDELDRNQLIIRKRIEDAMKKMQEDTEVLVANNYPFIYPKYPRF